MRKKIVLVALMAAVAAAAASSASAARLRAYRGTTSADRKIFFVIRVADDGRRSLKEMGFGVELLCEDATTINFESRWWFGGVGHRLEGRRLTFDEVFGPEALHITGVFRAQTADGTFKDTQATLTDTEEAQLCTTGDLTWTAERVPRKRLAELLPAGDAETAHRVAGGVVTTVSRIG